MLNDGGVEIITSILYMQKISTKFPLSPTLFKKIYWFSYSKLDYSTLVHGNLNWSHYYLYVCSLLGHSGRFTTSHPAVPGSMPSRADWCQPKIMSDLGSYWFVAVMLV